MSTRTKTKEAVVIAYQKGYRVLPDGRVARIRSLKERGREGARYLCFNVGVGSHQVYPVEVHRLAAVQKFGEEVFLEADCVRHLDGDSFNNRLENIELGSVLDNIMDRSASARQAHAKRASEKLSRKDWDAIDADRDRGYSYKELTEKYGVSKGSLSYRYSQTGVRRRLENR